MNILVTVISCLCILTVFIQVQKSIEFLACTQKSRYQKIHRDLDKLVSKNILSPLYLRCSDRSKVQIKLQGNVTND